MSERPANWNQYAEERIISRGRLLALHHRLALNFFCDYFSTLDTSLSVLEIGCGDGFWLSILRELGFSCLVGLDPSNVFVQRARMKGLDVRVGDIYHLKGEQQYEVILLINVLEHLPEVEQALQQVHRILRPAGILYLSVPVCDSLLLRFNRWLRGNDKLTQARWQDPTHLQVFSRREMVELLQRQGFRAEKTHHLSNPFPFVHHLSQRLAGFLQQFSFGGRLGDELIVIARREAPME